jgi:hypothetical protein
VGIVSSIKRWQVVLAATSLGALLCAAVALAAGSAKTVTGGPITVRAMTLKPGTSVPAATIVGNRVFVDATHGFALVQGDQAQYMAATSNGGKTWTTDSPALHIDAAQAPLSVTEVGAVSTKIAYAYGSGQVVDVTTNGGKTWYGALFNGLVEAVVPGINGHLVTYEQGNAGSPVQQYVSRNGGRTWTLTTALGGG